MRTAEEMQRLAEELTEAVARVLGSHPGQRVPDGSTTDVVCQSGPVFPAGTPEGFLGLINAQGVGPEATEALAAGPEDWEWVDMGVVDMTDPETVREREGDILVNDLMRVTDGIEPSDDPILHIRSHIYGESVKRRSGVERPTTLH